MGHIKVSTAINAPVDRVVEVASDPKHWASWWVNLGEAEKIEGDGGVGTVYNVPGSAVGKFADELIIERMQERAREQTLENLKLLVEAGQR